MNPEPRAIDAEVAADPERVLMHLVAMSKLMGSYRVRRAFEKAIETTSELVALLQRHGVRRAIEIACTDDSRTTNDQD